MTHHATRTAAFIAAMLMITGLGVGSAGAEEPSTAALAEGPGTNVVDPATFALAHETLVLDAVALRTAALEGHGLRLTLFGKEYAFALEPIHDLAPGATATILDGPAPVEVPLQEVILFRASTETGAHGMLSLPGDWVQGMVQDGMETIFLEPRTRTSPASAVETVAYRQSDMVGIVGGHGAEGTLAHAMQDAVAEGGMPAAVEPNPPQPGVEHADLGDAVTDPTTSAAVRPYGCVVEYFPTILVNVDSQYATKYGPSTWTNQVRTVINGVNQVYWRLCLTFVIDTMQLYSSAFGNTNNFDSAWSTWVNFARPSYIQFMVGFSGRDFDGCTQGKGSPAPGRYTLSQQVSNLCQGGRGGALSDQIYVPTHELGHNHNGVHEQADTWWNPYMQRSIMQTEFEGTIHLFFSHGTEPCYDNECIDPVNDPTRNNRRRVYNWIMANGR